MNVSASSHSQHAAAVAQRLVRVIGKDPSTHTILQENVSTLLNNFKPEFLDGLDRLADDRVVDGLNQVYANGPVHLALKVSRDLRQKPYDDTAVSQRLEFLDAQVKKESREIVEGSAQTPCKFYVVGSILKGRFGAQSDLDLLCEASPAWMSSKKTFTSSEDVSIQYIDMTKESDKQHFIGAFAPAREVTLDEIQSPGFLQGLYRESVEKKGLKLENGHLVAQGEVKREVETPPADSQYVMWGMPMV